MEYSIYVVKNKVNGKCYVGQTCRYPLERLEEHVYTASQRVSTGVCLFHKSIAKYGLENFELVCTKHCPEDRANLLETLTIDEYDSLSPGGYNLKWGGYEGQPEHWVKGGFCVEVRKKMSDAKKGRRGFKHTQESRRKIAAAHRGKRLSEDTKRKLSVLNIGKLSGEKNPFYGKKHSAASRKKMSMADRASLSQDQIARALEIKSKLAAGERSIDIARDLGCSASLVCGIKKGRRYSWL